MDLDNAVKMSGAGLKGLQMLYLNLRENPTYKIALEVAYDNLNRKEVFQNASLKD
jgi:hypothetical protein